MTLEELTQQIRAFRDERDWAQFHNPKDMAIAISLTELADNLGIDLLDAMTRKLEKNAAKYPADQVKGSSKKDSEYEAEEGGA